MIVSPGDLIGARYRVDLQIHDGRACARLLGQDTKTGRPVSIEIVLASEEADSVGVRFLSSARRAAGLVSSHVARVLDAGVTSDGHPYVVTEALGGETIAKALELRGSAPTGEAIDVAIDICEALSEAHASGLIHGDLTTETIQITPDVKVVGIGTTHATLSLRASDELGVRAPERLDPANAIDARTDVWGLGVVLYTMLAGASPFASDSPSNQNVSLALDEPPQLAGVPDALADIVDACLAKNPILRPQTIKGLAEELAPFATDPTVAAARVASWVEVAPESSPTLIAVAYEALRREKEAALVVDADPDSTAPRDVLRSMPPAVREMMKSEPPPAVSITVPPARAMREMPTVATRRPTKWKLGMHPMTLVGASACIVVASVIAASVIGRTEAPPPVAAVAPPAPEPRESPPVPVTTAAVVPASALPEAPAPTVASTAAPAPKRVVVKKPSPAPSDKPQQAAPAPEPKAEGDDLRKFLDDRR